MSDLAAPPSLVARRPSRVFISYATPDEDTAEAVRDTLNTLGLNAYAFNADHSFDEGSLWTDIRKNFDRADVYLLILTTAALSADGVRVELGWMQEFHQRNEVHQAPLFNCILAGDESIDLSEDIEVRCLDNALREDGRKFVVPNRTQGYFPWSRRDETVLMQRFAASLMVTYDAFGTNSADGSMIPEGWRNVYLRLFPEAAEQDPPDKVEDWVTAASRSVEGAGRELLVTASIMGRVVGFSYLSAAQSLDWVFGNYIGMDFGWRHDGKSRELFGVLLDAAKAAFPDALGAVFEIEKFNLSVISALAERIDGLDKQKVSPSRLSLSKLEEQELSKCLRIKIYQLAGAVSGRSITTFVLCDSKERWLSYWQPSMKQSLAVEDEVPLWLMCIPLVRDPELFGLNVDAREAYNRLWDEVFGESYGDEIEGYIEYLGKFKRRRFSELTKLHGRAWRYAHWRRLALPSLVRGVLDRTRKIRTMRAF